MRPQIEKQAVNGSAHLKTARQKSNRFTQQIVPSLEIIYNYALGLFGSLYYKKRSPIDGPSVPRLDKPSTNRRISRIKFYYGSNLMVPDRERAPPTGRPNETSQII